MCALRRGDAALHGPGPHGRGARRGGGASGRVQLLPETLSLRGEPAAVRASGRGLGADARRAETQARRPSHPAAVALAKASLSLGSRYAASRGTCASPRTLLGLTSAAAAGSAVAAAAAGIETRTA